MGGYTNQIRSMPAVAIWRWYISGHKAGMGKLTVRRIEALKTPGRYGDGGTLHLVVTLHKGRVRKQWVQRVVVKGQRRDIGLGGYPFVSLSEARSQAFDNRRLARRGGDPPALMQSGRVPTVGEAAASTLETHSRRWAASTVAAWMPVLVQHCGAIWGRPVDQVGRAGVIDVLKAAGKQTIVDKLKMRLRQTFAWAVAYGFVEANPVPVNGELRAAMPDAERKVQHHAALAYDDLPAFFGGLPATAGGRCLSFLILTCVRSAEARGAKWSEIDIEEAVWSDPRIAHEEPEGASDPALGGGARRTRPDAAAGRSGVPLGADGPGAVRGGHPRTGEGSRRHGARHEGRVRDLYGGKADGRAGARCRALSRSRLARQQPGIAELQPLDLLRRAAAGYGHVVGVRAERPARAGDV